MITILFFFCLSYLNESSLGLCHDENIVIYTGHCLETNNSKNFPNSLSDSDRR